MPEPGLATQTILSIHGARPQLRGLCNHYMYNSLSSGSRFLLFLCPSFYLSLSLPLALSLYSSVSLSSSVCLSSSVSVPYLHVFTDYLVKSCAT